MNTYGSDSDVTERNSINLPVNSSSSYATVIYIFLNNCFEANFSSLINTSFFFFSVSLAESNKKIHGNYSEKIISADYKSRSMTAGNLLNLIKSSICSSFASYSKSTLYSSNFFRINNLFYG